MSRVIELFKQITSIPRCSGTHKPFIEYMKQSASKNGYQCLLDQRNNILCRKIDSQARLCLQSHYDIVCLEDGKIPVIIEQNGYLQAKDSTLGADNGIGCAMMIALMEQKVDCEFLFTSDEEIGLIGANGIEFILHAQYMLNLDSETEGEICIGCAGGIDIFGSNQTKQIIQNRQNLDLYQISIDNLSGGHSGVDIDKEIPNAIKLTAKTIKECGGKLLDLNGGERINSIPKKCEAIIASAIQPQSSHPNMKITKIDTKSEHLSIYADSIIDFLYIFTNGVRGYDRELGVVLDSINLAIVQTELEKIKISLSARSMENTRLESITQETTHLLELFGFSVETQGKYPAWKPEHNDFAKEVLKIYKKHIPQANLFAIHAGLECAIFKDKYPNIKVCSIGPNIYFPHSNNEECEISSIAKIFKVVEDIVASV